jgi:uncharacterized membrane protein (UPF0127 family)
MRVPAFTLLGGAAFALAVACHKTPEEFVPPASSAVSTSAATTNASQTVTTPPTPTGSDSRHPASCPPDPEPNLKPLPTTGLHIADADSGPVDVEAEIAQGDHDTTRGLMYRTQMPEMHGMIFELDREDHAFWMHNTCISLDLVYIDHGLIVGIVESAPTLNDEPRKVGKPSEEVLELNAGFCQRHGVNVGQHVTRVTKTPKADSR